MKRRTRLALAALALVVCGTLAACDGGDMKALGCQQLKSGEWDCPPPPKFPCGCNGGGGW